MKLIRLILIILILNIKSGYSNNYEFDEWKANFKILALNNDISENTFDLVMTNVKYLPKVIEYDRYQPEFYEDTKTYISKRTSKQKQLNLESLRKL